MIYHITTQDLWDKALNSGTYHHPSLETEGFIHFSTKAQLFESAKLHFAGQKDLIVLISHEKWLKSILKWESGRNEEDFPHVYGKIPVEKIETLRLLNLNQKGEYELE